MSEILDWVKNKILKTKVSVTETKISNSNFWFYDLYNGRVINRKNSFFSIYGAEYIKNNNYEIEQPIILQNEIGYLGIVYKMVGGMPFLYLQAKIEPGNVNVVQISPTIQATKSNFTRAHGGKLPKYFEIFERSSYKHVIYDQLQPEQSTRFYKKCNRNLIISYDNVDSLKDDDNFKWISYKELIKLFDVNNLINMDTRTVISGLPYYLLDSRNINLYWYNSINSKDVNEELNNVFHQIGNYTMFSNDKTVLKPLYELRDWELVDNGMFCNKQSSFDVKYFDICINGREVQNWSQPLFCSKGEALFGLFIKKFNDEFKLLVSFRKFIGSNNYELAPTIQQEYGEKWQEANVIEKIFFERLKSKKNVVRDVVLSEEGGRFYHEQNRNIIIEIDDEVDLPNGYCFVSLGALKRLICMTQFVNIQLRNLISIIDIFN